MKFILVNEWIINLSAIKEIGPSQFSVDIELFDGSTISAENGSGSLMDDIKSFLNNSKVLLDIDDINYGIRMKKLNTKTKEDSMELKTNEENIINVMKWCYERGVSVEGVCKDAEIENPFEMDCYEYQRLVAELSQYTNVGKLPEKIQE